MGQVSLPLFLSPQTGIKASEIELKKKKECKEDWTWMQTEKVTNRWKAKIEEAISEKHEATRNETRKCEEKQLLGSS
jgi:hypothetical protein